MAPRRRDFGELSPRLLQLSVETNVPEAYQVTDKIVVQPPTKKRGQELRDAHLKIMVSQTLLNALLSRAAVEQPARPPAPEPPGDDAAVDQAAEYDAAVAAHEQAVQAWEAAVAEWETNVKAAEEQMAELADEVKQAEQSYNRAFFGDAHDDVMEFFDGQPQKLWDAFIEDIKADFLGIVNPPPDGTCTTCGQVIDAEEAGKALSSSTSSNTTGTPSRVTSPSTATEPTPETGSAAGDPGPSS